MQSAVIAPEPELIGQDTQPVAFPADIDVRRAPAINDIRAAGEHHGGLVLGWKEDSDVETCPIGAPVLRIGRSLSADIRFEDVHTSRRHALIICDDDGPKVCDDHSLNGVWVNGQRASADYRPIGHGDIITVGRTELMVVDVDE
jgi:hypothetical protein